MIERLLNQYPLISDQVDRRELKVILAKLTEVIERQVPGAVVELGCYEGTTSLFIQRLLELCDPARPFHVYDSFAGLPPKTDPDQSPAGLAFKDGALKADKAAFVRYFKQSGLPLPVIHKGWFADLTDADLPSHIAFAFLDGDFYESIKTSLDLVSPLLVKGGYIIVDDYQSEALPGAKKAVDTWLQAGSQKLNVTASLAVIGPFRT